MKKNHYEIKPVYIFSILTLISIGLRFAIVFQDITYLDRLFIPDDSYYLLSISRSIAKGLGPIADGLHLTSGFQPLICVLEVPLFLFRLSNDEALRVTLYMSAFFGGISTFVLGYLIKHLSTMRAAIFGSILWIFCPVILKNDLNGMETSLAGFLSLLALLLVVLIDKNNNKISLICCLGLVCGLAFLARVDNCFLISVIAVFALLRWGFYRTLFILTLAFIVVLPWWIYALKTFGSLVPESGMAIKHLLIYTHKSRAFLSLSSLYALIEWLPLFRETFMSAILGIFLTIYLLGRGLKRAGIYGYLLGLTLLLQWAFYTFYLPAFWFFTRYYYLIYAILLISISLAIFEEKNRKKDYLFLMIIITYVVYIFPYFEKPEKTPAATIDSLKGYREVALEVNQYFSAGDVVGAFQSGALGYYAPSYVRIINLDGVVNFAAAKALATKTMKDYVDLEHMNRFADWEYNAYLFQLVYGGVFPGACFNTIYRAKSQGDQHMVLRHYRTSC